MTVSVVIPAYNAEAYLNRCLLSVSKQTLQPNETIIINDASTDATEQIAKAWKFPKIITHEKNMGIGYSRQHGANEAKSDYVAYLSADDAYQPHFLEVMMQHAKLNRILFSDYWRCDELLNPKTVFRAPPCLNQMEFHVKAIEWALQKNMFTCFSTVVIPKWMLHQTPFRTNLRQSEDLIWLLESLIAHYEWMHIPEPLVYYRVIHKKPQFMEWKRTWEHITPLLDKLGVPPSTILEAQKRNYEVCFPTLKRRIKNKISRTFGKVLI